MTISPAGAAKLTCKLRDWQLSNLALQKTLYIAHMVHLGRHGTPLVNETFEAWDYGPVLPSVYRTVSGFGAAPIKDVFYLTMVPASGTEYDVIKEVAIYLAPMTPGQLVNITHWNNGAWARAYRPGQLHTPIPNAMVLEEYAARQMDNRRSGV